jgi:hypothetical protein
MKSTLYPLSNLFLIGMVILLVLLSIYPNLFFSILYIGFVVFLSIKFPVIGLSGWIMGYPFFNIFTSATGILGYIILSPLILFTYLSIVLKKANLRVPLFIAIFIILFIFNAIIALLFTSQPEQSLISFLMVLFALFILVVVINVVGHNKENLNILNNAYVYAVFAIIISTLITGNFFGVGRLNIGESIRRIANVASPAFIVLFTELILRITNKKSAFNNNLRPFWFSSIIFVLLLITLFSTVSRGALLAVIITSFSIFLFIIIFYKSVVLHFTLLPYILLALTASVLAFNFVQDNVAGNYLSRLSVGNLGENLRWEIWLSGINQMKEYEYIIGAGPNVFRRLAILGGYDYYAHSVFIDTFVTFGLLGLILLSLLLLSIFIKAIKNKNIYSFGFIVLAFWLYITHGNLTGSLDFWTLLGLSYASFYNSDNGYLKEYKHNYRNGY